MRVDEREREREKEAGRGGGTFVFFFFFSLSLPAPHFSQPLLPFSGLPGYAGPIADALDPTGTLLPVRLYRPATRPAGPVPHTKDLAILGRDLGRTVLLDNSPWSFLLQPGCGVPAAPFSGEGGDTHLHAAVLPLLEGLAADPALDVRPALAARFGMAAWLAGRGGWALYTGPCGHLQVAHDTCPCAPGGDGASPMGAGGPAGGRASPPLVCVEA